MEGGRALMGSRESGIPFFKRWVYLLWLSNSVAWNSGWLVGVGEWEEVFGALGALGAAAFF